MPEVQPALTPAEWKEFLPGSQSDVADAVDDADETMLVERRRRDTAEAAMTARRYNAAAALALHGQPFGFTWEDVERCRDLGLNDLADRIAALLPPR